MIAVCTGPAGETPPSPMPRRGLADSLANGQAAAQIRRYRGCCNQPQRPAILNRPTPPWSVLSAVKPVYPGGSYLDRPYDCQPGGQDPTDCVPKGEPFESCSFMMRAVLAWNCNPHHILHVHNLAIAGGGYDIAPFGSTPSPSLHILFPVGSISLGRPTPTCRSIPL